MSTPCHVHLWRSAASEFPLATLLWCSRPAAPWAHGSSIWNEVLRRTRTPDGIRLREHAVRYSSRSARIRDITRFRRIEATLRNLCTGEAGMRQREASSACNRAAGSCRVTRWESQTRYREDGTRANVVANKSTASKSARRNVFGIANMLPRHGATIHFISGYHTSTRLSTTLGERHLRDDVEVENPRPRLWNRAFQCAVCRQSFQTEATLKMHQQKHQPGEIRPYECPECLLLFQYRRNLYEHLKIHGEKRHECEYCHLKFHQPRDLRRHVSRVHSDPDKPYACSYTPCTSRFVTKSELRTHERYHSGERPYQCLVCKERFVQPTDLMHHSRTHHVLPQFRCSECGAEFSQLAELKRHRKAAHSRKADKIECPECNITFGTSSELRQHIEDSHEDKTKGWSIICSECGDGFVGLRAFAEHQKKVHGRKTHIECPECGAPFASKYAMRRHMDRFHSKDGAGELPKCKQCLETFPSRAQLRMHRREVHGFKDAKCDFCGETFSTAQAFKQHYRIFHPEAMENWDQYNPTRKGTPWQVDLLGVRR